MPYPGLKLMPVDRSQAAPKSISFSCRQAEDAGEAGRQEGIKQGGSVF